MSLDSVALLVAIEQYFGIDIPNEQAEKIGTIGEMSDALCGILSVTEHGLEIQNDLIDKLNKAFVAQGITTTSLDRYAFIFQHLDPNNQAQWRDLETTLGLTIPIPDQNPKRFFLFGKSNYDWTKISLEQFVDAIATANYIALVTKPQTRYGICIGIRAITADWTGTDCYTVTPEKSFTADLGID